MRICSDCYDIKNSDHECPSNSNRSIKHQVMKSIDFPKLQESQDPHEHRLAILKKLVKDYESLGFSKKKGRKPAKATVAHREKREERGEREERETPTRKPRKSTTGGSSRKSNPYMNFASKMRRELKDEHPDIPMTEMSKLIGKLWRELDDNEKERYR